MKIPIGYPGGKSKSAKYINRFIPDHKEFREPFFGGGSMSFFRLINNGSMFPAIYKASDMYKNLYCFWRLLKDDFGYLLMRIEQDDLIRLDVLQRKDIESRLKIVELFKIKKQQCIDEFIEFDHELLFREAGYVYFFLNSFSFSCIATGAGMKGMDRVHVSTMKLNTLRHYSKLIKNIDLRLQDYSILINEEGQDVFIFLDPPYYGNKTSSLYGHNGELHRNFDHQRLLGVLKGCKHRWLMTYDNHEYIHELYSGFYINEFDIQYSIHANKNKINKEIMISNYDINNI